MIDIQAGYCYFMTVHHKQPFSILVKFLTLAELVERLILDFGTMPAVVFCREIDPDNLAEVEEVFDLAINCGSAYRIME